MSQYGGYSYKKRRLYLCDEKDTSQRTIYESSKDYLKRHHDYFMSLLYDT